MTYNDSIVKAEKRHYYSSSHDPFHNANNLMMFYGGGDRGKIVHGVIQSLRTNQPLIQVHGERGSGKTMLSLVISDRLKDRCNTIRFDLPEISESLLLRHLLIELCPQNAGLISVAEAQKGAAADVIEKALSTLVEHLSDAEQKQRRKPYVLTIDTAANIDKKVLRIIQRITQRNAAHRPLMHCILYLSVDKNQMLAAGSRHCHVLSANQFWLRRLTLSEVSEYLRHHMMLFDFNRRDMFTREMSYFIADRSEGVFKAINKLARDAFTLADLESSENVSMSHLLMAGLPPRSDQTIESGFLSRHRAGVVALMGSCVVASVAATVFLLQ